MSLRERVGVADFVGVVRVDSVRPSRDAGVPDEQRQDWFVQIADATVVETLKGANVPSHITIEFDNGHGLQDVLYARDSVYLVFLAYEPERAYSTINTDGFFKVQGGTLDRWEGSEHPVTLDAARSEIAKLHRR
jgi:hypothetical protein